MKRRLNPIGQLAVFVAIAWLIFVGISGAEGISEEAVELVERWIRWAKLSRGGEA